MRNVATGTGNTTLSRSPSALAMLLALFKAIAFSSFMKPPLYNDDGDMVRGLEITWMTMTGLASLSAVVFTSGNTSASVHQMQENALGRNLNQDSLTQQTRALCECNIGSENKTTRGHGGCVSVLALLHA